MAKMTIYVPDELKTRMDGEKGVSWSPIACRAFEAKLAESITKRGTRNMQDVVARLRNSRTQRQNDETVAGRAAGQDWAKQRAEAHELERLEKLVYPSEGWEVLLIDTPNQAFSTAEIVFFAIFPDANGDRRAAECFWTDESGFEDYRSVTTDFVRGFGEGAIELWDSVKDQL